MLKYKAKSLSMIAVIGVIMGMGCQKELALPSCENGSCCWEGLGPTFVKRVDAARADYGGTAFSFKDPLSVIDGFEAHGALVCPVQKDMLSTKNLFNNYAVENNKVRLVDSTRIYPYRVWGIIYKLSGMTSIGSTPNYAVRVEKIEEIN